MNIETSILINASPEKVWNVLTAFENYPKWNPFVKWLTGNVAVGNQIKVALPGMNFTPTILKFDRNQELRWIGKLLFKGVFDGEHYFKLTDNHDGTTTFVHGENFSGVLVGLFKKKLLGETKRGFEEMNKKLKLRVEAGNA